MKTSKQKLYTDPKTPPPIGSDIYLNTQWYIDHGEDDFSGGLCKVTKIRKEGKYIWVTVAERPNSSLNWACLANVQKKLAKEFGNKRGHADPDYNDYDRNEGWHS